MNPLHLLLCVSFCLLFFPARPNLDLRICSYNQPKCRATVDTPDLLLFAKVSLHPFIFADQHKQRPAVKLAPPPVAKYCPEPIQVGINELKEKGGTANALQSSRYLGGAELRAGRGVSVGGVSNSAL
ncbi:hypothetical protein BJY52DRAFT_117277 [Lactarius psammicola]|nr:hypothetical protein BJY52DRAFT_117277 [Lactarius psammicola]